MTSLLLTYITMMIIGLFIILNHTIIIIATISGCYLDAHTLGSSTKTQTTPLIKMREATSARNLESKVCTKSSKRTTTLRLGAWSSEPPFNSWWWLSTKSSTGIQRDGRLDGVLLTLFPQDLSMLLGSLWWSCLWSCKTRLLPPSRD